MRERGAGRLASIKGRFARQGVVTRIDVNIAIRKQRLYLHKHDSAEDEGLAISPDAREIQAKNRYCIDWWFAPIARKVAPAS